MRRAFSMVMAIFVIVIMSTVGALIMNLSGKTIKATTAQYYREQAALLARGYTELAIMAVMEHNRSAANDCIEDIDGDVLGTDPTQPPGGSSSSGSGYNVQTRIYYLGNNLPCSESRKLNDSTNGSRSSTVIATDYNQTGAADSIAAILVDVYVRYKDPDMPSPSTSPWITYFRRTLQKI